MTGGGVTDGGNPVDEDARWITINGRRWRRTDPVLLQETVGRLQSHLGRGRSAVRNAKRTGDDEALRRARRIVDLAKHGLGERGPYWWDEYEQDRRARAEQALAELDELSPDGDSGV